MSAQPPKLNAIKLAGKPIKLLSTIQLPNTAASKKLKMNAVTAFWPKKESEDDGLPES